VTPQSAQPLCVAEADGREYVRMFHRLYGLGALSLRYFQSCTARGWILEGLRTRRLSERSCARAAGRGGRWRFAATADSRAISPTCATWCAHIPGRDGLVRWGTAVRSTSGADTRSASIESRRIVGGPRVNVAPRPVEPRDTLADLARARAILGWRSRDRNGRRRARADAALRRAAPAVNLSRAC